MYMGMKSRGIIKIANEKLKPKLFIENFGESNHDYYVELSKWEANPLILYTSAVLEALNPKEKRFTKKSENEAWEILFSITQEEVLNSVSTLEDANKIITMRLANIQTVQRSPRKASGLPPENVRWSDRNFVDYFFMKYQQMTAETHPRIKMKTAEDCVYKLRKYYDSDDKIRAHIDAFFKAYTGKDNYAPKVMLVGNDENIYQVQIYMKHGVLESEYEREESQKKKIYTI
ncbi:hypothetical protein BVG16_28800 [Paenibacillus selenitireducens]|uniref:Uncharacterized protein n=2 Tax=Paenibacillus selenitireducens TaxID=1324314 RepID=A0A1T2X1L4_9BACL|nr:hypothetical protein BVG16_28800 [Paenibacillus selenitireducens]